jgi:hypothetical protein
MSSARKWIALGLVLAAPVLLAQGSSAPATAQSATPTPPTHHKSHKSNKTPKPIVLPPLPSGPLSQLPMDQIPATKATVSFEGGLLTISAQNSTLGEILRDVRKLTGASIEIPQGSAASERVVTHLGPGAPRDVMAGLLNGSSFDYVMLGSSSDPTAISSVILLAKPSSLGDKPGDNQTAANGFQGPLGAVSPNGGPPQPFNRQQIAQMPGQAANGQPANAQDDSKDDDSDTADDNADDQAQAGQSNMNGANGQDQQQQPDPNQPNAGPKTPEQILEMLQRQRQQQAGPAAPGVPPPQPPQPPQE